MTEFGIVLDYKYREFSKRMAQFQELARQQKKSEGELLIADLPRLQQALQTLGVDDASALSAIRVRFQLQGMQPRFFGESALPMLSLAVQTELPLVCQRCFAALPENMDLHFEFALADTPPEALLEDEQVDWLEEAADASIESLVEDELLMALPIAVMHPSDCVRLQQSAGDKPNPFAVLKNLKLGQ